MGKPPEARKTSHVRALPTAGPGACPSRPANARVVHRTPLRAGCPGWKPGSGASHYRTIYDEAV